MKLYKIGAIYTGISFYADTEGNEVCLYRSAEFEGIAGLVGFYDMDRSFVLLDAVLLPEGATCVSFKILTADGLVGWIDLLPENLREVVCE